MKCIVVPELQAIVSVADYYALLDNKRRKCPHCGKRTLWMLGWDSRFGPSVWCKHCEWVLENWYEIKWAIEGINAYCLKHGLPE